MKKKILAAATAAAMLSSGALTLGVSAENVTYETAAVSESEASAGSAKINIGSNIGTPFKLYRHDSDNLTDKEYESWREAAIKFMESNEYYQEVKKLAEGSSNLSYSNLFSRQVYKDYLKDNKYKPKITGVIKGDFDDDKKVEAYVSMKLQDIGDKKCFVVYLDHDKTGKMILGNSDAKLDCVLDYGSFSHAVISTGKKLKYYSNSGKLLCTTAYTSIMHDDKSNFIAVPGCKGESAIFWDNTKKCYVKSKKFPTYTVSKKTHDMLVKEFRNICEIYSVYTYPSGVLLETDANYIHNENYDFEQAEKDGYYYSPVDPKFASTKNELIQRLRSSLTANFISDSKLKALFKANKTTICPDNGDSYTAEIADFIETKNGLEAFQFSGPLSGCQFDYDTFFVTKYTGKTAYAIVLYGTGSGDWIFRKIKMVRSDKYGWRLDAWEDFETGREYM